MKNMLKYKEIHRNDTGWKHLRSNCSTGWTVNNGEFRGACGGKPEGCTRVGEEFQPLFTVTEEKERFVKCENFYSSVYITDRKTKTTESWHSP